MRLSGVTKPIVVVVAVTAGCLSFAATPAQPGSSGDHVDLELILAVDLSLSMSPAELAMQRDGYVNALRDPAIMQAIKAGPMGKIAITYFEWGGSRSQAVVVPWTVVGDREDADRFAEQLAAHPILRSYSWDMGTSITGSMIFADALFRNSTTQTERRVVDISGDGFNNSGAVVPPMRDALVEEGITINGLPLVLHGAGDSRQLRQLKSYYENCVTGGPTAFVIAVDDITKIDDAIRRKLAREIVAQSSKFMPASAASGPIAENDCSNPGQVPGR